MCDFKEKHGKDFTEAYSFMERHWGATEDEEWEAISNEMPHLSQTPLSTALVVPILTEIENVVRRMDTGKLTKVFRFADVEHILRPMYERVYKFAWLCYRADSAVPESVKCIKNRLELSYVCTADIEREMMERCYKVFYKDRLAKAED